VVSVGVWIGLFDRLLDACGHPFRYLISNAFIDVSECVETAIHTALASDSRQRMLTVGVATATPSLACSVALTLTGVVCALCWLLAVFLTVVIVSVSNGLDSISDGLLFL
jgi:hypothetical protein